MKLSPLRLARRDTLPTEPSPGGDEPESPWRRLLTVLRPRDWRSAVRRNPGLKLFSLLLAFFLWFSINVTERDAERIVELPVSIRRLEPGLVVTNPPAKPIAIALRGPRTILDGVDERKARVTVDLGSAAPGDVRLDLNGDMIRPELPRRLKVVRLEPARLKVRVERLVRRSLPVKLDLAGMPAFGYTVAESEVSPEQVEVTGPASKVDALKEITTEPIDLRGQNEPLVRQALLSWAGDFVSFTPDQVSVKIRLDEVMVSREFRRVEVRVLNADGLTARLTPAWIDLTVRGPQRLLHNYKVPEAAVFVDAAGFPAGTHKMTVRVELPPAISVVSRQPEVHQLQLTGRRER